MKRLSFWRSALAARVDAVKAEPFAWGTNDCGLFAASCVEAMTGADLAAGLRGRYSTPAGARRALRRLGVADHVGLAERHFAEVHPSRAATGDLAVVEGDGGPALGVVNGARIYVMRPDGLGTVDLLTAKRAFRVQ